MSPTFQNREKACSIPRLRKDLFLQQFESDHHIQERESCKTLNGRANPLRAPPLKFPNQN